MGLTKELKASLQEYRVMSIDPISGSNDLLDTVFYHRAVDSDDVLKELQEDYGYNIWLETASQK